MDQYLPAARGKGVKAHFGVALQGGLQGLVFDLGVVADKVAVEFAAAEQQGMVASRLAAQLLEGGFLAGETAGPVAVSAAGLEVAGDGADEDESERKVSRRCSGGLDGALCCCHERSTQGECQQYDDEEEWFAHLVFPGVEMLPARVVSARRSV
jgi:hypothetical protein